MKKEQTIMGMLIEIEIADKVSDEAIFDKIFSFFRDVDERFSTYKTHSEISKINRGEITTENYSEDMKEIIRLAKRTKEETNGYFEIVTPEKIFDPSGIVKGWAIKKAGDILKKEGFENFYVDAGGDIETYGRNKEGKPWTVGIRNPFKIEEVIKVLSLKNKGIATSGTYIRGQHIYNPKNNKHNIEDILSLTVIGPNVYEADRFATAAFAMGREGILFIENLPNFEGYMIDKNGIATMTNGFDKYVVK